MVAESGANTGSVRWVGHPGVTCDEALSYTVTDEDGTTYGEGPEADAPPTSILQQGYVISGIPESELDRFVLNRGFEPADDLAQQSKDQVQAHVATRVNGSELDEFEIQQLRAREAARAEEGGAELSEERAKEIEEQFNPANVDPETRQLAEAQEQRQEARKANRTPRGQRNVREQQAQDAQDAEANEGENSEANGEEGEGA